MTVLFLMAKYGWRLSIYIYYYWHIYNNVCKNHKDNIVTQSNHYRIYIVGNIESIWVWNRKWKKKLKRAMFKKLQVLTSITECSIACMRYLRSFPHCMHILQKCIRMRLYFCSWEKLTFLHNDLFSFMWKIVMKVFCDNSL